MYPFMTLHHATAALDAALNEIATREGADAIEIAHADIVRHIAADCPVDIADELLRREGVTR